MTKIISFPGRRFKSITPSNLAHWGWNSVWFFLKNQPPWANFFSHWQLWKFQSVLKGPISKSLHNPEKESKPSENMNLKQCFLYNHLSLGWKNLKANLFANSLRASSCPQTILASVIPSNGFALLKGCWFCWTWKKLQFSNGFTLLKGCCFCWTWRDLKKSSIQSQYEQKNFDEIFVAAE